MSADGLEDPRYTAWVYGHGLVDWPPERLDAFADHVRHLHLTRRWVMRRRKGCRECDETWPCPWSTWALHWQAGIRRRVSCGAGGPR